MNYKNKKLNLKTYIIIAFFISSFLPLILMGIISNGNIKNFAYKNYYEKNDILFKSIYSEIEIAFHNPEILLSVLSSSIDGDKFFNDKIENIIEHSHNIESVYVLDKNGILKYIKFKESSKFYEEDFKDLDFSNTVQYKNLQKVKIGKIIWSNAFFSPLSQKYTVSISTKSHEYYIIANLSTDHIEDSILKNYNLDGIGAFILDKNGTVILSSDNSFIKNRKNLSELDIYIEGIKHKYYSKEFDFYNKRIFARSGKINKTEWVLIVFQDLAGFEKYLSNLRKWFYGGILTALLASSLLLIFMYKKLGSILNNVNYYLLKIQNGDYKFKIKKNEFTEIEAFLETVRLMRDGIYKREEGIKILSENLASVSGEKCYSTIVHEIVKFFNMDGVFLGQIKGDLFKTKAFYCSQGTMKDFSFKLEEKHLELFKNTFFELKGRDICDMFQEANFCRNSDEIVLYGMSLYNSQNILSGLLCMVKGQSFVLNDEDMDIFKIFGLRASTEFERNTLIDEIQSFRLRLDDILNSLPSAIMTIDREDKIIDINRAGKDFFVHDDRVIGKCLSDLFPPYYELKDNIIQELKDSGYFSDEKYMFYDNKNQKNIFYSIQVIPIKGNENTGHVVLIKDISENVRLHELMIQTEKMMSVGGIAAGVAHEINNPLSGILQALQNIKRRININVKKNIKFIEEHNIDAEKLALYHEERGINKFIDDIESSALRASSIVNNMLNFSRENKHIKKEHNIIEIIRKSVEIASTDYNLKKKYDFRHIKIKEQFQQENMNVKIIESSVEQVFLNILKNAAHALHDNNTPEPFIEISCYTTSDKLRVEFFNNGPCIDEKMVKKLFEPFFTTKSPGEGTGLGLSVSFFIIRDEHNGNIWVENIKNRGVKFTVELPLY